MDVQFYGRPVVTLIRKRSDIVLIADLTNFLFHLFLEHVDHHAHPGIVDLGYLITLGIRK